MRTIRYAAAALSTALVVALPAQPAQAAAVSESPEQSASFNGTVRAIAVKGSVVFVGGDFTSATDSDGTYRRRHLAAVNAVTGKVLPWKAHTNESVHALALHKKRLFAAGEFTRAGGVTTGLARISTETGRVDRRFRTRVDATVRSLSATSARLYLGGDFTRVNGKDRGRLAALGRKSGALTKWRPRANRRVQVVLVRGKLVYVGGWFTTINRKPRHARIVAVNAAGAGRIRTSFDPGVDVPVMDLAATKRKVFLAGAGAGGRLVALDRSGQQLWRRGFDGDVQAVTVFQGVVYAGGHFVTMCASKNTQAPHPDCVADRVRTPRLAGFRRGGASVGWAPAADSNVGILALRGSSAASRLAVGGDFDNFDDGAIHQPKFALFG